MQQLAFDTPRRWLCLPAEDHIGGSNYDQMARQALSFRKDSATARRLDVVAAV